MNILALDLATTTGGADGAPGSKPRLWTWVLSDGGDDRPSRLGYLQRFLTAYFAENPTDEMVYEKPLGIAMIANMFARKIFVTNEDTLGMLRGAIGVAEACAAVAGVPIIRSMDVQDARKHLLGQRRFGTKNEGKQLAFAACKSFGWAPANLDEADAAALWSLACGQHNPRLAAAMGRAHLTAKPEARASKHKPGDGPLFRGKI